MAGQVVELCSALAVCLLFLSLSLSASTLPLYLVMYGKIATNKHCAVCTDLLLCALHCGALWPPTVRLVIEMDGETERGKVAWQWAKTRLNCPTRWWHSSSFSSFFSSSSVRFSAGKS